MILTIISSIIVGLILGVLARFLLPGKQNIPMWLTIVVGIVAAWVGGFIADKMGVGHTSGIDWIKHGIQIVLAVIGIAIAAAVYPKKSVSS